MFGIFSLSWLWLGALVLIVLCDVVFAHAELYAHGTALLLVGVLSIMWLGAGVNPFVWAWHNPGDLLTFFASYALVGCLWCVAKWWLFLRKAFGEAEEVYAGKLAGWRLDVANGHLTSTSPTPLHIRPSETFASNNKGRLIGWIGHWPFSMLAVVLGDFVFKIFNTLYKALSGLLDRMADSRFEGYSK